MFRVPPGLSRDEWKLKRHLEARPQFCGTPAGFVRLRRESCLRFRPQLRWFQHQTGGQRSGYGDVLGAADTG